MVQTTVTVVTEILGQMNMLRSVREYDHVAVQESRT